MCIYIYKCCKTFYFIFRQRRKEFFSCRLTVIKKQMLSRLRLATEEANFYSIIGMKIIYWHIKKWKFHFIRCMYKSFSITKSCFKLVSIFQKTFLYKKYWISNQCYALVSIWPLLLCSFISLWYNLLNSFIW